MRQKLVQLCGHELAVIARDSNSLLSVIDRSNRQKIIKDITELNWTINNLDVIDIDTLRYPTEQYTYSSPVLMKHFTKIHHILGHKTHLSKFKIQNDAKSALKLQCN